MKKVTLSLVLVMALILSQFAIPRMADAKSGQKGIIVAKIQGGKLYYHKAVSVSDIIKNTDWDNTVGYGKKRSIKMAHKVKYYLLNSSGTKVKKVSKSKFK